MALIWFEGFGGYDHYSDVQKLPNLDTYDVYHYYGTIYSRRGGDGDYGSAYGQYSKYMVEIPGEPTTIVIGGAFLLSGGTPSFAGTTAPLSICDGFPYSPAPNYHVTFGVNSSRLLVARQAWSPYNVLGTSSGPTILNDVWYFLEVKVTISDTVGQITVEIDENEVMNTASSLDTCNGTNVYVGGMAIGNNNGTSNVRWDDLYILDTTGSKNNDFLGDIRVDTLNADSAGTYTQFTPSTGSNYENVDEHAPDWDTTYNESGLSGDKDTYNMDSLAAPTAQTVHGLKSQISVRKTDSGTKECALLTRSGTTDTLGATITLSDSYQTYALIYEDNPDDSAAWEDSDVNAVQIGVKVVS